MGTDCRTECCLPSAEECDSLKSDYDQILTWHGIEKGRALTDQEVRFVVELIMWWIDVNAAECSANPP